MIPPPPKPARQSAIVTAGPEAKNSWENALESWSDKRKEQRSTWYKTETYPAGMIQSESTCRRVDL